MNPSNVDNPWNLIPDLAIPDLSQAAFIAPGAWVMGQVSIAPEVSIWYGAMVRGDVSPIHLGQGTNIQDGAILHGDPDQPTVLEAYVTVGHRAVIHSAHIETGTLVGIGAIVMNGVTVGSGCIIGAGAVVTRSLPPRSLVVGVPGKVIRAVDDAEAAGLIAHAQHYIALARHHARRLSPLS
ncbi:MAG: gamma carbonic anhydrase family protein [Gloeomargaritaceae cyanobacterium C42_A2020_066]|nr:gamma carbonic anhydrase family protein [Gloeomargaritaceae cyanobacterium C42_A2020_066]